MGIPVGDYEIMKEAVAFLKNNAIYIHANSLSDQGIWIPDNPFIRIDIDTPIIEIGNELIKVLDASRKQIPHPTSWSELYKPLLLLAKVKSERTFMRNVRSCNITQDNQSFELLPHENMGKGTFYGIPSKKIILQNPSLEELGQSLLLAFNYAK